MYTAYLCTLTDVRWDFAAKPFFFGVAGAYNPSF